jgi:hypothetical protein
VKRRERERGEERDIKKWYKLRGGGEGGGEREIER